MQEAFARHFLHPRIQSVDANLKLLGYHFVKDYVHMVSNLQADNLQFATIGIRMYTWSGDVLSYTNALGMSQLPYADHFHSAQEKLTLGGSHGNTISRIARMFVSSLLILKHSLAMHDLDAHGR